MTFAHRMLVVIALLGIVSLGEFLIRGTAATRWRLSLFLIFAGVAGGVFGVTADLVTSSISKAYFEIGKGLGSGPGLEARIARLGLQAGASAGAIVGCVLVIAGAVGRLAPPVSTMVLTRALLLPALAGVTGGLVGFGLGRLVLPESTLGELRQSIAHTEIRPFLVVWSTHVGIYAGGVVGTILGALAVWRRRRSLKLDDTNPSAGTTSR